MNDLLHQAVQQVIKRTSEIEIEPSPEDYEWAEAQTPTNVFPPGSKQRKNWVAMGAKIRAKGRAPKPVKSQAEKEAEWLQDRIKHDAQASYRLMGSQSAYKDVALEAPGNMKTQCLTFFLTDAIRYPLRAKTVLLLGGNGSGKTFAGIGWASKFSDLEEFSSYFIAGPKLVTNFQTAPTKRQFSFQYLENVRVLMIDDLPTRQDGSVTMEFISYCVDLIKGRHEKGLRTVITSNSKGKTSDGNSEFWQCYGDRLKSIIENQGLVFETTDPDFRNPQNRQ